MAAWSGTLTVFERLSHTHLADIWSVSTTIPADGFPDDPSETLVLTNVPAYRRTKSAVDSPGVAGLLEGEDMVTTDVWRFPKNTALDSSWLIVDRSQQPTGGNGPNYNEVWAVKGDPVKTEDLSPAFPSGKTEAYTTRLGLVPEALRTHYGLP